MDKVFPLFIQKYETFTTDNSASLTNKINSIVQALNQLGKISNDVVHDWNKVMEWSMGEGLDEATDKGIDKLVNNGRFDELIQLALVDFNEQVDSLESSLAQIATQTKASGGDDTTAIQAVIDNSSKSKNIHFPDGTYTFKNINLPSGIKLTFSSGALIQAPTGSTSLDSFFKITGTSGSLKTNIQIGGGVFDGKSLLANVVSADYVDKLIVTNLDARNVLNATVAAVNSNRVLVRDCLSDGAKYGVLLEKSTRASVQGCYLKNLTRDGILVYSGSQYIEIVGNTVENYTTGLETGRAGIHGYGSSDITVTGNIVLTGNGDTEGIRFRDSNNFTCTGNEVVSPGASGIAVVRIGDYPGLDGGYGTISSNAIINPKLRGISVPYTTNKPVTVVGNTILNATSANINDPAVGIVISSPFSTVSGNVIDGSQGNGIQVSGNNISVTGNVIKNVGTGTAGARVGISIVTGTNINCTNNTITDNQATKTMQEGIRLYADSTANLENNLITGWVSTQLRLDGKLLLKNSGRVVIPNAATSVVVTHGLNAAPTLVYLTSQSNELGTVYVTGITATQFTVNCTTAPTGGRYVTWKAEV